MSKGDWRRPVNKKVFDQNYEEVFGQKKLNVMSDEEREQMEAEKRRLTEEVEGCDTPQE